MEKREGMCANKFILLRLYANIELQKNGYFMFRLDGIYVIDTILNKTYSVILCKIAIAALWSKRSGNILGK